jgi:hypothetical protein
MMMVALAASTRAIRAQGVVMKKQSLVAVLAALAAMICLPDIASADHRFGTDRGSRYSGGGYRGGHSGGYHGGYHGGGHRGYHGGSSRSYWNVSVGFGSGGYHRGGYSNVGFSFGRSPTYYRGGYTRYYSAPVYCPPPVVYAPAPRVVYVAPPPVVYYPAVQPIYTSSYYYSSGGYYCGR